MIQELLRFDANAKNCFDCLRVRLTVTSISKCTRCGCKRMDEGTLLGRTPFFFCVCIVLQYWILFGK